ncbi:lipid-binding SYLF domain-containing protein [Thiolapillus sp.]
MTATKARAILAALLLLVFPVSQAWADECQEAVELFKKAGASAEFFNHSYGYAIFPSIGKGAIGVGGAYGTGCVYAQGRHVGNATMTQVSVGFQLGGEAYTQIIFFQDQRAFNEFTSGNFEFSANARAVAITAGASATASTAGSSTGISGGKHDATTRGSGYNKGMATFTIAKAGLMYEASLAGQKYEYKPL